MTEIIMTEPVALDASTLRRIALLVMRVGQDDDTLRRPMIEIWNVIDQLKKDVARGWPLSGDNVVRLGSLISRLARKGSTAASRRIHTAILNELRDLGRVMCPDSPECHCH
ncbi:MAG TPA: hypothetical protein VLV78_17555 [Thermoanaerobaculia bacterium]|nr:hypothetical protein [Thermoanaerobaculia bacterium]